MRRQVTIIITIVALGLGAATAGASPLRSTDPRSPDARDAATVVVIPSKLLPSTQVQTQATPAGSDGGTAWDTIAIASGGALLLVALASGAVVAVRHRRRATGVTLAH